MAPLQRRSAAFYRLEQPKQESIVSPFSRAAPTCSGRNPIATIKAGAVGNVAPSSGATKGAFAVAVSNGAVVAPPPVPCATTTTTTTANRFCRIYLQPAQSQSYGTTTKDGTGRYCRAAPSCTAVLRLLRMPSGSTRWSWTRLVAMATLGRKNHSQQHVLPATTIRSPTTTTAAARRQKEINHKPETADGIIIFAVVVVVVCKTLVGVI